MSQQSLTIEKLVYGGTGLSRSNEGVVLVPFTLPAESVIAEVGALEKGVRRGQLVSILNPSPDRVDPFCPYFLRCGGCHYQHTTYEVQLSEKRAILEETLQRVGRVVLSSPIEIIAAEPRHYRNRVQLHFEAGRMGYRAMRSRDLVEIDHCPISSPKLNDCIASFSRMVKDSRWPAFIRAIELFTDEHSVQLNVTATDRPVARRFFDWCAEQIPGFVTGALDYEGFRVSKGSFFQVNRFLFHRLVEEAVGEMSGETALDLYAGVGLFAVPLARRFRQVTAVESGSGAVRDLQFNAERSGVTVEAVKDSVDPFLAGFSRSCDLVIADPPRAGLGKSAVNRLIALAPERIVLVACDPTTLARDLAPILAGGYELERIALIDLFPQTYHIETVAKLKKKI